MKGKLIPVSLNELLDGSELASRERPPTQSRIAIQESFSITGAKSFKLHPHSTGASGASNAIQSLAISLQLASMTYNARINRAGNNCIVRQVDDEKQADSAPVE